MCDPSAVDEAKTGFLLPDYSVKLGSERANIVCLHARERQYDVIYSNSLWLFLFTQGSLEHNFFSGGCVVVGGGGGGGEVICAKASCSMRCVVEAEGDCG